MIMFRGPGEEENLLRYIHTMLILQTPARYQKSIKTVVLGMLLNFVSAIWCRGMRKTNP